LVNFVRVLVVVFALGFFGEAKLWFCGFNLPFVEVTQFQNFQLQRFSQHTGITAVPLAASSYI
jgi:hypothetical protein